MLKFHLGGDLSLALAEKTNGILMLNYDALDILISKESAIQ
jgi:hypothetical protein